LKETRPLWPPQRGVGLQEPNLGKTNPCVSLYYLLTICFAPSLADSFIFLTLTRLVVVFIFENFSFALFTPPLGDYQVFSAKNLAQNVARKTSCLQRLSLALAASLTRSSHNARTHALPVISQTCAATLPMLLAARPPPSSPLSLSTPLVSTDPARAQDNNLRVGQVGSNSGIRHHQSASSPPASLRPSSDAARAACCNTLNLGYKISFLISTKFRCYPLLYLLFFYFSK
jgi:hypothetical protein